jgi:hypothetical protein
VALFYKDNAERQKFVCEEGFVYDDKTKEIISKQEIKIDFRYAPEITPNIIIFEDVKIIVDNDSGLSGFWDNEIFDIPTYARIAYYLKLQFTSGIIKVFTNKLLPFSVTFIKQSHRKFSLFIFYKLTNKGISATIKKPKSIKDISVALKPFLGLKQRGKQ